MVLVTITGALDKDEGDRGVESNCLPIKHFGDEVKGIAQEGKIKRR
ncbi:MAG: hypothetical protein KME11_22180 [Timaviella obliquedivisa GSE-PSE-MK23-08B]|jgi:hypothetical protein|nr:hypothetical protein [Timaviella obliquedivisa GSE-PSE-MK23-08B]